MDIRVGLHFHRNSYISCTYKYKILVLLGYAIPQKKKKSNIISLIFLEKTLNKNERNKHTHTQAEIRMKLNY